MNLPNIQPADRPMEDQTMRGMTDDLTRNKDFVDLRLLIDDKTVLKNPHKGWFWHYVDNGLRRPQYRDRTSEDDDLTDFPALNHLYLRFDWSDIEKKRGHYDFSSLDAIMERWGTHGYTFSLRACAFEGGGELDFAAPRYVFEEGAKCYRLPDGVTHPDYGDPHFMERLEAFMEVFGKKYNGDKRIELVDIGTYGTWGEGHTVCGDGVIYPTEVVKRHFDLHAKYFPDTFVLCNDDHIAGRMAHGKEEVLDMLDYAAARGFGVQDDSICCDGYSTDCDYDTMRAPWAFERLYHNAPSCIEFAHYTYIRPEFDCYFRDGFTIIEALKRSRATFAGFHGYPRDWLARERYLTEYCANRLGYWFFIPYAVVPPMQNSAHNVMKLKIENHGWAKAYWNFTLKVRLSGTGGEKIIASDFDLRTLGPDSGAEVTIPLDLRGLSEGEYAVSVGIFDGDRPVKLAMKENARVGDFYEICRVHAAGI
ncbi:MAG: DUF4832 domain-containing protein [Clostridia bacterium]|nr:DUF4832 domain-containing protein [Clostridia bacterium]